MGSSGNRKGKGEVAVTYGSQSSLGGKSLATNPLDDGEEPLLSLSCDCFKFLPLALEPDRFEPI